VALAVVPPEHLTAAAKRRIQEANRARAAYPYAAEHAASLERNMEEAKPPQGLTAKVNWARRAYSLEPPFRIHAAFRTDAGGDPALSGEFLDWVEGITSPVTGRQDHEESCPWRWGVTKAARDLGVRGDCRCYYRWPLRFALWQLHGRFEDTEGAWLADLCLDIAQSHDPLPDVGMRHGVAPIWSLPFVARGALSRLWWLYSPVPRNAS